MAKTTRHREIHYRGCFAHGTFDNNWLVEGDGFGSRRWLQEALDGVDRGGGYDNGRAGALFFFAGALPGFGLFLLPLEFIAGELETGERAERTDELKPKLRFFLDAFGQSGDVETVEHFEQVKLSDGYGGGVEIVQVLTFGEITGDVLLGGEAIHALMIADPALEWAFGIGSEIGFGD